MLISLKKYFPNFSTTSFLFLAVFINLHGQTVQPPPGRKKLILSDYKGVPDESSNFLATTNMIFSYHYHNPVKCPDKNRLRFSFETGVAVSSKSWMKTRRIKSQDVLNELLSHEQGHYDMKIIFASHLKKSLSEICFNKDKYKLEIDSVFKKMNNYYDSLQLAYDKETDNMRNREKQLKWKQKIEAMLKVQSLLMFLLNF